MFESCWYSDIFLGLSDTGQGTALERRISAKLFVCRSQNGFLRQDPFGWRVREHFRKNRRSSESRLKILYVTLRRGRIEYEYPAWSHARHRACVRACARTCVHACVTKGMPTEITTARRVQAKPDVPNFRRERERGREKEREIRRMCARARARTFAQADNVARRSSARAALPVRVSRWRHEDIRLWGEHVKRRAGAPKPELHARKYNDPFVTGRNNKSVNEIMHGVWANKMKYSQLLFIALLSYLSLTFGYLFIVGSIKKIHLVFCRVCILFSAYTE